LTAYGEPRDVVTLVDLPDPGAPAADEIIVRAAARTNRQRLLECLDRFGQLVIWSGMGREASFIQPIPLIFGRQSLHGSWIMNWLKEPRNMERLAALYGELAPLVETPADCLLITAAPPHLPPSRRAARPPRRSTSTHAD
jgi:D-arabinose 1-dehydrogenase-like Zn-dependent alcohol dehydrogenase